MHSRQTRLSSNCNTNCSYIFYLSYMKNILLLGATGSIGKSALKVIDQNRKDFNLFGISTNNNVEKCNKIIKEFSPKYVFIHDKSCFQKNKISKDISLLNNDDELNDLINHKDIDIERKQTKKIIAQLR